MLFVAILFCFLPLYYLTMSMQDFLENPLLRIFVGYSYSVIVAGYTLIAIGIYNTRFNGDVVDLSHVGSILKMIRDGLINMSQFSLKDVDIDIYADEKNMSCIIQFLIGGYGSLVIAHILKLAEARKTDKEP